MASRIAGITIEIGGDTSNLQKSLKGVDSQLKQTQNALKDVNKLLKLDPTNTDLLRQKQQLLRQTVSQTKERLDALKAAQAQMDANGIDKNSAQYQELQREIIETEGALKNATKEAKNFSPALEKIRAAAQKASSALAAAAQKTKALSTAAAGALTAIGGMGLKALSTADDLLTMAQRTGLSTDELQRFAYASDRVDVSVEDITKALTKLKTKIDPNNKSLAALGVSATNADGSLRDATDVFYDVLQALSEVENETERDQLAMDLFGKSADSLAGIIDDGGAALKAYGEEAENVGAIMDEQTLTSLGSMNDELDRLKAQGMATLIQTGAKALQALSPVLEKVAAGVGRILDFIGSLSPETLQVIITVLAVIAAISPLLSILSALATAIAFIASPVGIAIAAFAALVAAGIAIYQNWDTIKAKAEEIAGKIKESWENIKSGVVESFTSMKTEAIKEFNNLKTKITTTATNILTKVKTTFANIKTAITTPINTAKSLVESAVNAIKNIFPISMGKIFDGIKLPHFKIDGGEIPWGIGGAGKKPSVSIEWYRKAMQQPYILNGATIFGAAGGKLLGGGESGKEIIFSYDKLASMMRGNNVVINVYPSAGMNETELANKVQRVLVRQANQRRAAHA